MSDFCKFLFPMTIATGGWDFATSRGTVTVPAGTYSTGLELWGELEDQLDTDLASVEWTLSVSTEGIATVSGDDGWTWSATDTDASLKDYFGFTGSETVASQGLNEVLTSTKQHKFGWYPGVITYGTGEGDGIEDDTKWQADDVDNIGYAGTGAQRRVGPARNPYRRRLRFGLIHYDEAFGDKGRGPSDFKDAWQKLKFRFYPDRDDGTVATPGDRGDPGPGTYDVDGDEEYWRCSLVKDGIVLTKNDRNPDYWSVQIELNCEPAP
jgi:hypothetical protein